MTTSHNYGIQTDGSYVQIGNVAIGTGATASSTTDSSAADTAGTVRIQELLDRIQQAILTHAAELAEANNALRDTLDLRNEFATPEPDRTRIMDTMRHLARLVSPAAAVAGIVANLHDILG